MKILVIGPSWVGDMMMSHSLYRTIKADRPDAEIDVMAPDWCRPLLARMPEVSHALSMPLGHGTLAIAQRRQLGRQLRHRYDHAYVLPNSFKSALIPFFAAIERRTGWRGEMRYGLLNDLRVLDKAAFPRMVERYVALAYDKQRVQHAGDLPQPLRWPQLQVSEQEKQAIEQRFALCASKPIIGFCPGAEFGPAKRWPHYHYAALAQQLIAQGQQVILLGSQKDAQTTKLIRQSLDKESQNDCHDLAGNTTLDDAVVLLAACRAVVSNDSGLMHIASALNRPLVALYGPSSPDFTPPLSHQAQILRRMTGYHKLRKGDAPQGYHQSLIDIPPEQVLTALKTLIPFDQERVCGC